MLLLIKCVFVIVAFVAWILSQRWLGRRQPLADSQMIGDYFHEITGSFHSWIAAKEVRSRFLLISSSLVVDGLGLYLIYSAIFGDSLRPLLGLLIIFGLRQLNQVASVLPAPRGMIWKDPGFPSLFVTYGVSNDLFFSGHTALAVYGALELAALGGVWMSLLAVVIVVYEIATVLLLKAHWTMDIYAGAITALLIYQWVPSWAGGVDQWLLKLVAA